MVHFGMQQPVTQLPSLPLPFTYIGVDVEQEGIVSQPKVSTAGSGG
jgi:hypothetical protein